MNEETSIGAGSIPTGPESVVVKPNGMFKGQPVFDCDSDTFSKCINGKRKYKQWNAFLGKNQISKDIKSWMNNSYKNRNFLLRNSNTGEIVYARNSN